VRIAYPILPYNGGWDDSTEPGVPALERGYDSVRKSNRGFEGVAAVPGPPGVVFEIQDEWSLQGDVLSVARRLAVSGHGSGGFLTSLVFTGKAAFHALKWTYSRPE
jgi:hypothetical protein